MSSAGRSPGGEPGGSAAGAPKSLRELAGIDVGRLKGTGPRVRDRLATMGIDSLLDLLQHYPRRYLDRTKRAAIADLAPGDEATVFAEVIRISGRRTRKGRALVEAVVSDGDTRLNVSFFNQAWRERQLPAGTEAAFFGKLEDFNGQRRMTNPVVDVFGMAGEPKTNTMVPLYPQSAKAEVTTWELQRLVAEALRRVAGFRDPLAPELLGAFDLADRTTAYRNVHAPKNLREAMVAQHRLKFDEFLRMQVGLVARKRALEADRTGIEHDTSGTLLRQFHARLPYELTGAQRQAVDDIARDMARPVPMHRLLQGDVGSGKTVVALSALVVAIEGGHQGALMAPTEVLAEQHVLGTAGLLEGLEVEGGGGNLFGARPVRVALLTNRTSAADRRRIQAELEAGDLDIVIGTHALLYGELPWHDLGLVVIDEQHRFGVEQRAVLSSHIGADGRAPDVLVMTATPIPRTAGMLIYGDLDKSELRELPPGRTPIATEHVEAGGSGAAHAYDVLREQVAAGRQAYVVCPLVEGSEKVEAKAATEEYERLASEELAGLRVGLLHGQMKAADKDSVMQGFRDHELDVLVATTVIEVGVDVPNATVMIVEDADRFGLSQLHQLRGRVGRGAARSTCFLVASPATPEGEARLAAMVESTDGFLLAERDLEIRGAGEVFGERQAGLGDLKLGRIPHDEAIVLAARAAAERLLDEDPTLARHADLADEVEDLLGDDVEFLFKN